MLKVVLVLRQLLFRLEESEAEVLVKKQKETIKSKATWSIEASNCCSYILPSPNPW